MNAADLIMCVADMAAIRCRLKNGNSDIFKTCVGVLKKKIKGTPRVRWLPLHQGPRLMMQLKIWISVFCLF